MDHDPEMELNVSDADLSPQTARARRWGLLAVLVLAVGIGGGGHLLGLATGTGGDNLSTCLIDGVQGELYGASVGGFCCMTGTASSGTCSGAVCALDVNQSQGLPLCDCYVNGSQGELYGESVGGFCCMKGDSSGGGCLLNDGATAGDICALDPSRAQGFEDCKCYVNGRQGQLYGESAGGFCCMSGSANDGECSTADVCALDANRTQGLPLCAFKNGTKQYSCLVGGVQQELYGASAGGFCRSSGGVCALDASRTQGNPTCHCPEGGTAYAGGGYCCFGNVTGSGSSCDADACVKDPNDTSGLSHCEDYVQAQRTCDKLGYDTYYGDSVGGFCKTGSAVCAFDPFRTQGNRLCSCPKGGKAYAGGGYCCFGNVTMGGASCDSTACALDPADTAGIGRCETYAQLLANRQTTCETLGFTTYYGHQVGGFCTGTSGVCAFDAERAQGNPGCHPATDSKVVAAYEPAAYKSAVVTQESSGCPTGQFSESGSCLSCRAGFDRHIVYVSGMSSVSECKNNIGLRKADKKLKGTGLFGMHCPDGQFWDPIDDTPADNVDNGGYCWTCRGWNRSAHSVTSTSACSEPATTESPTKHGASGCPAGSFADLGKCWSCPNGYIRTTAHVESKKACAVKEDGVSSCQTMFRVIRDTVVIGPPKNEAESTLHFTVGFASGAVCAVPGIVEAMISTLKEFGASTPALPIPCTGAGEVGSTLCSFGYSALGSVTKLNACLTKISKVQGGEIIFDGSKLTYALGSVVGENVVPLVIMKFLKKATGPVFEKVKKAIGDKFDKLTTKRAGYDVPVFPRNRVGRLIDDIIDSGVLQFGAKATLTVRQAYKAALTACIESI